MRNLEKIETRESYIPYKKSIIVNIQSGNPGINLSNLLFNVIDVPKIAYLRTIIDNKILIRKLSVLGVKKWLLIYENTLFMLDVKEKYNELEIYCIC
ncbi:MAG TPA: hypothetical protein VJ697_02495 [Nitrososphaeraceae archaeon]|nr:hypothetical protein [Nitrososphaeraceae archaeon]